MSPAMLVLKHIHDNFAEAFFPRRSEWVAATLLLVLGWMISVKVDLMAVATPAHGMAAFIAPQWVWSSCLIVFALARLIILLINGTWRRSPHARGITAFLSCFFWAQLTLYFILSRDPLFAPFFILPGSWLVTDMLNIQYAFRDARTVDHLYAVRGKTGERQ
jgi:hypothetical protein